MTFADALLASGYLYEELMSAFMKEDVNGNLHTYMHVENDDWIYEKSDVNDRVVATIPFTLN